MSDTHFHAQELTSHCWSCAPLMLGSLITKCSQICYWKHPIFSSVSRIFNHFRLMSSLVLPSFLYVLKMYFKQNQRNEKVFFCHKFTFRSASTSGPFICGSHDDQNYVFLKRISDHNSQMQFLTGSIGTVQAPHLGEILVNTMTLNLSAMMTDTLRSLASQWHRWYVIMYDSWCLFLCLSVCEITSKFMLGIYWNFQEILTIGCRRADSGGTLILRNLIIKQPIILCNLVMLCISYIIFFL